MRTIALTRKRKIWTDEALEALPRNGHKYELLDGDLVMSPVGANHGIVCLRIGSVLLHFVEARGLGQVFDSSTGFRLAEDLLLCPDVAFASKERLKTWLTAFCAYF
jgi:Uma2 family endonuclease